MEGLFRILDKFSRFLNAIAAVALTFMMFLTVNRCARAGLWSSDHGHL